ncbi:MAG: hypothetical protein NT157_06255 [Candidatus Micrarchaeota archaeon]|nr:hypothetical protein [Candidatus Micrarchaeota archaeon]
MKQFDSEYIGRELTEIGIRVKKPIRIYLIGGCAMSFRGLKETTKDIDIVFKSKRDYEAFCDALFGAQYFEPVVIRAEHGKLNATRMYENKDGFHLDLFLKRVCMKMELSKGMEGRAEFHKQYGKMAVCLVSKEDIFLFKSLASERRKRDMSDMRALYSNLDWKLVKEELLSQRLSGELIELVIRRLEEFKTTYDLDVPLLDDLKKPMKG